MPDRPAPSAGKKEPVRGGRATYGRGSKPSLTQARKLGQAILVRVAEDAAHASFLLDRAIVRHGLAINDAAWLTELVYGTLRHGAQLNGVLQNYLRAPMGQLPVPVQCALRAGAYQILHMRVPAYTAVDATVELLRGPFGRLADVANAVLRRVGAATAATAATPAPTGEPPAAAQAPAPLLSGADLATQHSHPVWLVDRWLAQLGHDETLALLQANNARPPLSLRVNVRRTTRAQLLQRLQAAGFAAEPSPILAEGIVLRRAGEVRRLPGYAEGHFVIQDMAPALVSHLLQVRPGEKVVDLCAAPGGKSTHLAELLAGTGQVLAIDSHPGRLGLVVKNATRLGHGNVVPILADACNPAALAQALTDAQVHGPVARILLDPPCSGSGTLRRHPELRQRSDERLPALCRLQAQMLQHAADLTAVGGRLVYAVCSVLAEEGSAQIARFLAAHDHFALVPPPPALAAYATDGALATWPHRHGMDGFYAACLMRQR